MYFSLKKTMKTLIILQVLVLICTDIGHSQNIAINNTGVSANPHAILDIDDTTNSKGLLIPRMTTTERLAIGGLGITEEGLTIYDSDIDNYWLWDGASWKEFGMVNKTWSSSGNFGNDPSTNFIGTIDSQSLVFKTNNIERFRIGSNGNIGIGIIDPLDLLHLYSGTDVADIRLTTANFGVASSINLQRASVGETAVLDGNILGNLTFSGFDGTNYVSGAKILSEVNGVVNSGLIPAQLKFQTNDGVSGLATRMVLSKDGDLGIGTLSPQEKLDINGTIRITDGTEGAGKVLTSDANGTAKWETHGYTYAQLSDSILQNITTTSPTPIIFSTNDEINGVSHTPNTSAITIQSNGVYYLAAQPQVNRIGTSGAAKFHCWVQLDKGNGWEDIPNSNILREFNNQNMEDVIIVCLTQYFDIGDKIRIMMSTTDVSQGVHLQPYLNIPNEPNIPSIIFTMFKI